MPSKPGGIPEYGLLGKDGLSRVVWRSNAVERNSSTSHTGVAHAAVITAVTTVVVAGAHFPPPVLDSLLLPPSFPVLKAPQSRAMRLVVHTQCVSKESAQCVVRRRWGQAHTDSKARFRRDAEDCHQRHEGVGSAGVGVVFCLEKDRTGTVWLSGRRWPATAAARCIRRKRGDDPVRGHLL